MTLKVMYLEKGRRTMRTNLVNARKKLKYAQTDVSKILGISERQYQRLESGDSQGSLKIWKRLRELFGLSIDLLEQVEDIIA